MGLSGIVAQIVLLRELLVTFLGNELIIGIILANWMILEAAGSFAVGKAVERAKRKLELYVLFQLCFSMALPFSIYQTRVIKNILLATPGEAAGFAPILFSSFLILLPVALPHGALFTLGCRNYSLLIREDASSIGRVYVYETLGSIAGGLLITFLVIQNFHSFQIALGASLLNTLISIFLLWPKRRSGGGPVRNPIFLYSIFLTVAVMGFLFSPLSSLVHVSSIRRQWRNLNVLHNENSIYGNITVTERDEQFTFFTDGIPSITTPVPDIAQVEDFVHFSMLFHENPESVLVLSGGAGGMIHEILKHPVRRLEYVELDPLLLKLIETYETPLTQSELSDRRVKIHYTDSRFFVKRTTARYDVIFIGLSAPQELQTNRLFSREFFSLAKERMNRDGIIALTLPGSLTYIGPELRDLNGCILDTLESAYRHVRVIPGDVNLYFASDSEKLVALTSEEIIQRLDARQIHTNLFTHAYIEHRLHERWLTWFAQNMERTETHINSDFHPLGVFFNLAYWNALFSPYLTGIFTWIEGLSLTLFAVLIAVPTLLLSLLFMKRPGTRRISLPYAISATGFAGMIFDLAIIFTFQTTFGYLYYQIGILVTIFMVGVAISSFSITRRLDRIKRLTLVFLTTELCLIIFSLALPLVLILPSLSMERDASPVGYYTVFLMMSLFSGILIGLQFPLACRLSLDTDRRKSGLGHTAGSLYAADLLGGYFGGLIGGVLLLPILGLKNTCFILAMIKGSSFLLCFVYYKRKR
jgi:spermidine synthase